MGTTVVTSLELIMGIEDGATVDAKTGFSLRFLSRLSIIGNTQKITLSKDFRILQALPTAKIAKLEQHQ